MFRAPRFVRLAGLLALLLSAAANAADGELHRGVARVVDGDTIVLEPGPRVRLFGIDAPEAGQACESPDGSPWDCGAAAAARLAALAEGRVVVCEERDRDQYDRVVAICRLGDRDLNATLVGEGLAFAYRAFSTRYLPHERAARAARAGIFAGAATAPWDYRAARRVDTARVGPNGCTIKGNISRSGRRLYHTPEGPDWAATRIDESSGERWFCSEAQARAAGWTRAHR